MTPLRRLLDWVLPHPTFSRTDDGFVRQALIDQHDTGNALDDSFHTLMIRYDPHEFERALMLVPENNKHLHYFIDRWRDIYIKEAIDALEAPHK